jgi:hypothetical protein
LVVKQAWTAAPFGQVTVPLAVHFAAAAPLLELLEQPAVIKIHAKRAINGDFMIGSKRA